MQEQQEKVTKDDIPMVTSLRNLLRQGRIDKGQFEASLATMLATGAINKSQFLRLKNAAK